MNMTTTTTAAAPPATTAADLLIKQAGLYPYPYGPDKNFMLDYDTLFGFCHWAVSPLPKQFSISFTVNDLKTALADVIMAINTMTDSPSFTYSENVFYGLANYDEVISHIKTVVDANGNSVAPLLGNVPVPKMPPVPSPIRDVILKFCYDLFSQAVASGDVNTFFSTMTTTNVSISTSTGGAAAGGAAAGGGAAAVSVTNLDYPVAISMLGTSAVFTVTGAFGGIKKFVNALPGLYIPDGYNKNLITWETMAIDKTATDATSAGHIPVAVPDLVKYPGDHYYEIAVGEFDYKLHGDLGVTKIRGYTQIKGTNADGTYNLVPFKPYGPIFFAKKDVAVRMKFVNILPTGDKGKLFIPCDTTLMGAGEGPLGAAAGLYTQNRTTPHLHGGVTPWISDGTPQEWITPKGEVTSYKKGVSSINVPDMPQEGDGVQTYYYPNNQAARLLWWHDHSYGITRLNVMAGMATLYSLTDDVEQNLMNDIHLPSKDYTFPLVVTEKTFLSEPSQMCYYDPTWYTHKATYCPQWGSHEEDANGMPTRSDMWGSHQYCPNQNPNLQSGANDFGKFDYGPWFWPPFTSIQIQEMRDELGRRLPQLPAIKATPETFCDTPLINGVCYPFMNVEPRPYRFRILNACNDRTIALKVFEAKAGYGSVKHILNEKGQIVEKHAEDGDVPMVPATLGNTNWPDYWPTDGRNGGVPDPAYRGPSFNIIQNEAGFLTENVQVYNTPTNFEYNRRTIVVLDLKDEDKNCVLCTAERADVIIDFSKYAPGASLILYNDAPAPNPGKDDRIDYFTDNGDNSATGGAPSTLAGYGPNTRTLMQFRVVAPSPTKPINLDQNIKMMENLNNTVQNAHLHSDVPPPLVPTADTLDLYTLSDKYGKPDPSIYTNDNYIRIQDFATQFKHINDSCVASANIVNGSVASVDVFDAGINYNPATTVVKFPAPAASHSPVCMANMAQDKVFNGFGVSSINIVTNGKNYSKVPNVTISAPSATDVPALASAIVDPVTNTVTGIRLTNPEEHFGYYSNQIINVTIVPPAIFGGVQATATAIAHNGRIIQFTITNPGSGYDCDCGPTVTISPPASTGTPVNATAVATLNVDGSISAITVTNPGLGYNPNIAPTIFIDEPDAAEGSIVWNKGSLDNITIVSSQIPFNGNIITDVSGGFGADAYMLAIVEGFGTAAQLESIISGGSIIGFNIINHGHGYLDGSTQIVIDPPTAPIIKQGGIQATAIPIIQNGQIVGVTITNGGKGYESILDPNGGTLITPGVVVTTTKPASYVAPKITYVTQKSNKPIGYVKSLNIVSKGIEYVDSNGLLLSGTYNLVFTGTLSTSYSGNNAVSSATGTATFVNGILDNVTLTSGGSGYSAAPKVTITIPSGVTYSIAASVSAVYDRLNPNVLTAANITGTIQGFTTMPIISIHASNKSITSSTVINGNVGTTTLTYVSGTTTYTTVFTYTCNLVNTVKSITVTNPGKNYGANEIVIPHVIDQGGIWLDVMLANAAILEEFNLTDGTMNATMGFELPRTNAIQQTSIASLYCDPPPDWAKFKYAIKRWAPTRDDGTKIWKLTHNGVDTHSLHIHCFDSQLINRSGWDGAIYPPDPMERGFKETYKTHPLEDTFYAFRAVTPKTPFGLPNCERPMCVDMPLGMTSGVVFTNVDPAGNPTTTTNVMYNYHQECMVHCHILGHEENDMMNSMVVDVPYDIPYVPNMGTIKYDGVKKCNIVSFSFEDFKMPKYLDYDPKSFHNILIYRSTSVTSAGLLINPVVVANVLPYIDSTGTLVTGVANINTNTRSFTDYNVVQNTSYYYLVVTINANDLGPNDTSIRSTSSVGANFTGTTTMSSSVVSGNINLSWITSGFIASNYWLHIYKNGLLTNTISTTNSSYTYIPTLNDNGFKVEFSVSALGPNKLLVGESNLVQYNIVVPNSLSTLSLVKMAAGGYQLSWPAYVPSGPLDSASNNTIYLTIIENATTGTTTTTNVTLPGTSTGYTPAITPGNKYTFSAYVGNGLFTSATTSLTVSLVVPNDPYNIVFNATSVSWTETLNYLMKLSGFNLSVLDNSSNVTYTYFYGLGAAALIGGATGTTNTYSVNYSSFKDNKGIPFSLVVGNSYVFSIVASNEYGSSKTVSANLNWSTYSAPTVSYANGVISWTTTAGANYPIQTSSALQIQSGATTVLNTSVLGTTNTYNWTPTLGNSYTISVQIVNLVGSSTAGTYSFDYFMPTAPSNVVVAYNKTTNTAEVTWISGLYETSTNLYFNKTDINGNKLVTILQYTLAVDANQYTIPGSAFTTGLDFTTVAAGDFYNISIVGVNVNGNSAPGSSSVQIWNGPPTTSSNATSNKMFQASQGKNPTYTLTDATFTWNFTDQTTSPKSPVHDGTFTIIYTTRNGANTTYSTIMVDTIVTKNAAGQYTYKATGLNIPASITGNGTPGSTTDSRIPYAIVPNNFFVKNEIPTLANQYNKYTTGKTI